ncbi:MAG: VCBS repeat-containing protein [Planctomycetota bacterium]|nr:MAG: VCBS repeat-containing protein [Planctomycetota bacterium]
MTWRKRYGTAGIAATALLFGCTADFTGLVTTTDFLETGRTLSFFEAFQVDPQSEDSAGPQFVAAADLNNDGLTDLVSAWNQSQPVQVHIQQRPVTGTIRFETTTLAGSVPVVSVAGLAVDDFDQDGHTDIAVLVKESLTEGAACLDSEQPDAGLSGMILLYLGPDDPTEVNQPLSWIETPVGSSLLQGAGTGETPETGGFTAMAAGDMDEDGDTDLVVAWNSACGGGTTDVVIFTNGGAGAVRDGSWTGTLLPDPFPQGSAIKDVALGDLDGDGDLDVVATFPDAPTMNVRWYRNPTVDVPDEVHVSDLGWAVGTVAQIPTGADVLDTGDIDGDGRVDVLVRSTNGKLIQWMRGPEQPTTDPIRQIPWQVYTVSEFTDRTPDAIRLGDLDGDGFPEVIASAAGALLWFAPQPTATVFDQWEEVLIVDDGTGAQGEAPATTDPNVQPEEVVGATLINNVIVADLDGDGSNDIVATLDRAGLSGLTNDALAWFRNLQ